MSERSEEFGEDEIHETVLAMSRKKSNASQYSEKEASISREELLKKAFEADLSSKRVKTEQRPKMRVRKSPRRKTVKPVEKLKRYTKWE